MSCTSPHLTCGDRTRHSPLPQCFASAVGPGIALDVTGDDVFILGEPTAFTPPSAQQQQQQTAGLSPGAIAGTIIGAVAGAFLMICLLWLLYVRYGKRRGTTRAAEAAPLTAADGEEESEDDDGEAEEDDEEDDEAEATLASASASAPRRSPTLVGPVDVTPTFAESAAASAGPSLVGPSSLLLPRGPTLTAPPESQVRPPTLVPPSEHAVAAAQRLPTLTGPAQTPALGVAATAIGTPTGPSGRVPMQVTLTGPAARVSLHGRSSSAGQAGARLAAAELDAAAAVAAASLAPSARLRLPRPSGGDAAPVATTVDASDVVLTARSQQPQPTFMLGAAPRLSVGGSRGPLVPSPLGRPSDASRAAAAAALGGALPLDGARLLVPAGSPRAASGPLAGARLLASEAEPRTSTRLSASSVAAAAIASSSVRLSIGGGGASARPSAPSAAASPSATAFTAAAAPAADSARASLERLAAAASARALAAPAASPRAAATSSPLTRSSSGSSVAAAADVALALGGGGSPVRPLPATALLSAARPPPEPRLSSSSFAVSATQPLLFDDVDTGAASPEDGSGASMADLGGRMLQVDGGVVTGRGAAQLDVAPKPPSS